MHDDERLRRPCERDVEMAEPGLAALVDDQRRLDDDEFEKSSEFRLVPNELSIDTLMNSLVT